MPIIKSDPDYFQNTAKAEEEQESHYYLPDYIIKLLSEVNIKPHRETTKPHQNIKSSITEGDIKTFEIKKAKRQRRDERLRGTTIYNPNIFTNL